MVEIRGIEESEYADFRTAVGVGFGEDNPESPEAFAASKALFPIETCIVAEADGRFVGTFGSFPFELTIPGGTLPMAGTTIVTVQPTHRRQGLLTQMMQQHLDQVVELGQPIAGLWASESAIYSRFGYGPAAVHLEIEFMADSITLPPGPDSLRLRTIDSGDAATLLPPVYEGHRAVVPGALSRSDVWWEHRILGDLPDYRNDMSKRRIVIAEDDGGARGYVLYRQKSDWSGLVAGGKVTIDELIAVDDDARRALWSYITNIDLFPKVVWWNAAPDEPLFVEADEPRRIESEIYDGLWLRILDLKRAVEARTWSADGRLVLDVVDDTRDTGGLWAIEITDGRATCERTTAAADVTLGIGELGALYLGGRSAHQLQRSGRIMGSPDAVVLLDRMAWWPREPHCSHMF